MASICCGGAAVNEIGGERIVKRGGCSGCKKESVHELVEANILRRSIYKCAICGSRTMLCRKRCGNFACGGKYWDAEKCLVCYGSLKKWELTPDLSTLEKNLLKLGKSSSSNSNRPVNDELADALAVAQLKTQAEQWFRHRQTKQVFNSTSRKKKLERVMEEEHERHPHEVDGNGNGNDNDTIIKLNFDQDSSGIIKNKDDDDDDDDSDNDDDDEDDANCHEQEQDEEDQPRAIPLLLEEDTEENAPLTDAELRIKEKLTLGVGRQRLEGCSEAMIVRYIRAFTMKSDEALWLETATKELEACIEWRMKNNVSSLVEKQIAKSEIFDTAYPSLVTGTDTQGHPIMVQRARDLDLDLLCSEFTMEELAMLQAQRMERIEQFKEEISEQTGRRIYKHVLIMDLDGVHPRILRAKDQMDVLLKIGNDYYAETLHRTYLINAPTLFRVIWAAVAPMIHKDTKAKIKIIGSDYMDKLGKGGVFPSQLPASIKGTSRYRFL